MVAERLEEALEFEADEEEQQPVEIPQAERRVYSDKKDWSIFELHRQQQKGRLETQPEFQRFYVWDDTKASRLIESVLLEVPIPIIYLAEEHDGRRSVIDGQQRLTSFFRLLSNDLRLRGLGVLTDLTNKTYKDLASELQSKFDDATIRVIVIGRESHPDVRFEIFERLNTGAVKLNDHELRNCVYRGTYNQLLHELAEEKDFQFLLGRKQPDRRMQDREIALRFFAFYHTPYINYRQPMKRSLSRDMDTHRNLGLQEQQEHRRLFKDAVQLTKSTFGDRAFRRFIPGSARDPNGVWEERRLNRALIDIVLWGFTRFKQNQVMPLTDALREELLWLMTHDQEFIDAITLSTNDVARLSTRFEIWSRSLKAILGTPRPEPRLFSSALKKQLWEADPTCKECGNQILTPDDAEVDHIDFYWRGGQTIPSNARLLHRYCNRKRGGGPR